MTAPRAFNTEGKRQRALDASGGPAPGDPPTIRPIDEILDAIARLDVADQVLLISRLAPEFCRASMVDPDAMTMLLAECRRVCHDPETQRRLQFVMEIMRRMKGRELTCTTP